MNTTAHPRVATPHGGSAARNTTGGKARRLLAAATALALGGGLALVAPLSATADERAESYAEGRFLSGTLLGMDLDRVLELESAEAWNDGTQSTMTDKDPLDADVLQAITIEAPAPQIDLGGVLQLGPVGQYAQANSDGSSLGASGAVVDDGVIGVGSDTATPPANATFDLEQLLGAEFASTLVDLKLELGAIAARAEGDLDTATGDYQLGHAILSFTSPAIADLTPKVDSALEEVVDALSELVGPNGELLNDVNGRLLDLDPLLNLLGGSANVSVLIDTGNLTEAVHSILLSEYGNGAVSFSLETGEVRVDLEKLLGGDLNNLAPGTELLTDAVVNKILEGITSTVATIADQVVDKVDEVLRDAKVSIHADLATNVTQAPVVQEVCRLVDRVVTTPLLGEVSVVDQLIAKLNGLVGELTGDLLPEVGDYVFDENGVVKEVLGFVNQTVQETVCSAESSAVAPLTTSVVLDITATIDQLLAGVAAHASADVSVLGLSTKLDLSALLGDLGGTLLDDLFDSDGAVQDLVDALESGLVHPATEGLLGSGAGTVGDALRDLVSVKVNIQETSLAADRGMAANAGRMFTQTAVRVSVLGSSVATVNLAQATVGPNIAQVIDDPEDPGDPGTPTGNPKPNALAYTGVGIALLVALILALLAAGAYLVREGYRRNHSIGIE